MPKGVSGGLPSFPNRVEIGRQLTPSGQTMPTRNRSGSQRSDRVRPIQWQSVEAASGIQVPRRVRAFIRAELVGIASQSDAPSWALATFSYGDINRELARISASLSRPHSRIVFPPGALEFALTGAHAYVTAMSDDVGDVLRLLAFKIALARQSNQHLQEMNGSLSTPLIVGPPPDDIKKLKEFCAPLTVTKSRDTQFTDPCDYLFVFLANMFQICGGKIQFDYHDSKSLRIDNPLGPRVHPMTHFIWEIGLSLPPQLAVAQNVEALGSALGSTLHRLRHYVSDDVDPRRRSKPGRANQRRKTALRELH